MKSIDVMLVEQAKQGDDDSFAQLYEEIAPGLYRTAFYTLGNSHDAEDAVAETFMEAYNGIGKLRDNNAFVPWMFRILSARCKRKIKGYIQGRNEFDLDSMLDLDDGSNVSEEVSQRSDLLHAMEQLTAQEREIVVLAVVEGYTTKEVAQILRCPHGTISSKLFRTLKKLRKMMEE